MKVVLDYILDILYLYNGTIPYWQRDATRHAWGWLIGTQLIYIIQTPWDATDTISWRRDATNTSPDLHIGAAINNRMCLHNPILDCDSCETQLTVRLSLQFTTICQASNSVSEMYTQISQMINCIVHYVLPGKARSPCKQWMSAQSQTSVTSRVS
jgi:hypothetical protein